MSVEPVQIVPVHITPKHPVVHSIRVQHGHNQKVEVLPQQIRTVIFLIQQEPQNTLHTIGSWSLSRMHPPRNYDFGFPYHIGPEFFIGEDALYIVLSHLLTIPSFGDGQELKFPFFFGVGEHLIMKVDILMVHIFESEFLDKILAILVGVGEGEGKLDPFVVGLFEFVLEAEFHIILPIVLTMIDECT